MLNEVQKAVHAYLAVEANVAVHLMMDGLDISPQIRAAAGYAYALYHDLRAVGVPLEFPASYLGVRPVPPTDPGFFDDIQVLVFLVGMVEHAAAPASSPAAG